MRSYSLISLMLRHQLRIVFERIFGSDAGCEFFEYAEVVFFDDLVEQCTFILIVVIDHRKRTTDIIGNVSDCCSVIAVPIEVVDCNCFNFLL